MRLSTKIKTTFAIATATSMIGAVAWAQNLRVMGTTTGEGNAYFNSSLSAKGSITMTSPDSTNIYALALARTNENGRSHVWKWWHMNNAYGQDSLQLWEYQSDSAGVTCGGNEGSMCDPRLTIAKGGNVGVGVQQAAYKLDVDGAVRASGNIWATGMNAGYGLSSPPSGGAIIAGGVGIGTSAPSSKLNIYTVGANDGIHLASSMGWLAFRINLGNGSYNNVTQTGDKGIFYSQDGGLTIGPWMSGAGGLRLDSNGNATVNGALVATGGATVNGGELVATGGATVGNALQVNGTLRSTTGMVVYKVHSSCPGSGTLTTATTCKYCTSYSCGEYGTDCCGNGTASNPTIGRLVDY